MIISSFHETIINFINFTLYIAWLEKMSSSAGTSAIGTQRTHFLILVSSASEAFKRAFWGDHDLDNKTVLTANPNILYSTLNELEFSIKQLAAHEETFTPDLHGPADIMRVSQSPELKLMVCFLIF